MAQVETEKLTQILWGAALSRAVCTIAELGIADQIEAGSPQSVESLAGATGIHERSLYRILRFLDSHGIFREKGNRQFDHTPLSHCLRSDAEGSFRPAAQMMHRVYPAWDGLHHAAISGESGFNKVFGQPLFDYLGTHPDLAPIFDAGMTAIHGHETTAMLEAYDFSAIHLLADIGGGNGSLIGAVLQRYPKLKGLLFDLGHVVRRTRNRPCARSFLAMAGPMRLTAPSERASLSNGWAVRMKRKVHAPTNPLSARRQSPAKRCRLQRFVGIPPNQHATGDIESMDLLAGQSVGLVAEIQPAGELVRRITRGAEDLISRKLMPLYAQG